MDVILVLFNFKFQFYSISKRAYESSQWIKLTVALTWLKPSGDVIISDHQISISFIAQHTKNKRSVDFSRSQAEAAAAAAPNEPIKQFG